MTNTKSTKRALLASVMAMLLCFTMLLSTTFAWFTDSVVSENNIIVAGNLDVKLEWSTDASNWDEVTENTNIFKENTLWEPGHTEVVYLKITNVGSLALKYQLGINVVSETAGTNVNEKPFKLSDYIKYGIVETDTAFANRADALKAVERGNKTISAGYTKANALEENNETDYIAMIVYMPETVGNEANYKTGTAVPEIKLGINLMATQYTHEEDSYGSDYDAAALPCDIIATPETIQQILDTCEPGTVIGLSAGGYYEPIVIKQNDITLIANPNVPDTDKAWVDFINLDSKHNIVLDGITFDAYAPREVQGVSKNPGLTANIVGATTSTYGAANIQIRNCEFLNYFNQNTDNYVPIAFYENGRKSGAAGNIVVDNCKFLTNAERYIYIDYAGDKGGFTITNNTFGTLDTVVDDWAIRIGYTKADVTISGNTFFNCGAKVNPHNGAGCTYALNVAIVENEFYNTTGATLTAIGCKYFHALPKCQLLVKDNVINGGAGKFENSYVADNDTCYDIVANTDLAIDAGSLQNALASGGNVDLIFDVFVESNQTGSNGYGATGVVVKNGQSLDGHGNSIGVDAWTTWDSAINTTGGTIKNVVINSGMRGIFMSGATDNVYIDNVIIDGTVYTFNSDAGNKNYGVYISNSTLNGWTSYSNVHMEVVFDNCNFGEGQGYAFLRAYNSTEFKNCHFDAGFEIEVVAGAEATFENCYYGDTLITADNIATLGLLYETDISLVVVK
ncbi:MAG: hypothetical protein IKB02_01250 [Clostridia bacterium]|nr:hypothetical protein [Clostridia bacterium]